MKSFYLPFVALLASVACTNQHPDASTGNFTAYVDPKIGSGGHGHVFVGANVPYGMVQLGPTSIPQQWDWCSGYHDSDSTVIGFSHTHLSGTGVGDLFDVTVMPVVGEVNYARGNEQDPSSGLWSYADRNREVARPGYYSVPLSRYGILAEMTATPRVGMHRYTFPASDSAAIVIDLQNGGCWDSPVDTHMEQEGDNRIVGYRYSKGWANDQRVFFVAEFDRPFDDFKLAGPENMYGRVSFTTDDEDQVLMKVAISPSSIEGAKANLAAELPGWDFDATAKAADKAWNDELGRIRITDSNTDNLKKFYTALYHTMFAPVLNNDVNGDYRGADGEFYTDAQNNNYTILSLWDTYRAEMPLLTIIDPKRSAEIINSMLDISEKQQLLPVWHLWSNETNCMVGNPGIIPVADAVAKRLPGVDAKRAMERMIITSNDTLRGGALRQKYGFIPSDLKRESIAYDMEYAIADAAIANAAKAMGDTAAAAEYTRRSHSYRNYFDSSTGFMRGRFSNGEWRTPFDPFSASHRNDDYCEGNAWQYTWLVPHDLEGLESLFGSRDSTISRLDALFEAESVITGEDVSPDISGLIGQYAHGNEPVHHVIYFYTMLGQPDKAADRVRQVLSELYTTNPDGLSGNEDAGQMSAWYVLSSLGFYQPEPAGARFWFGSPLHEEAVITVPNGTFTIKAPGTSDSNRYIRGVKLNGKPYELPYITYDDIMKGGELIFEMGSAE